MKDTRKSARADVKAVIMAHGKKGLTNPVLAKIGAKHGLGACDMQNVVSYFEYSKTMEKFRAMYF